MTGEIIVNQNSTPDRLAHKSGLTGKSAGLVAAAVAAALGSAAHPAAAGTLLYDPGDLLVSTSTYTGNNSTVVVGQTLPGGGTATNNGAYNQVFQNATPDASFGVTSPVELESFNLSSKSVDMTTNLTAVAAAAGVNLATSFSSKSELALNTSSDGSSITFMAYNAPVNILDASNSNTPGVNDPTNPVASAYSRDIGTLTATGLQVTQTNAYSGNNGRAAILANGNYYLVGNAGNGSKSGPVDTLSQNTGVQMLAQGSAGPNTTVVGRQVCPSCAGTGTGNQYGFSVTALGDAADKTGKDDNFRGETVFNNTLYVTKGSGSNGVDTVYQVGATGSLPTAATASSTTISVLPGFNTALASKATGGPNPFGIWFANASTLYVADEGNGANTTPGSDTYAGLEKWSLVSGTWKLDYTLQTGLNIGQNYTVTGGLNADGSVNPNGTGSTYTTATAGLRNLTGEVNANGTVSLYAVTSTISTGTGDQGADPNKLVAINDVLGDTAASQVTGESFTTLQTAAYGQVLRGVDLAPVPLPAAVWLLLSGLGGLGAMSRRRAAA
jgi:hypothetical protein